MCFTEKLKDVHQKFNSCGKITTHSVQKGFLRKIIKDQILNLIKEQLAIPIRFVPLLNQYAEYRYEIVNLI